MLEENGICAGGTINGRFVLTLLSLQEKGSGGGMAHIGGPVDGSAVLRDIGC